VKQNLSENMSADSFLQEHTTVHCGGPWEKEICPSRKRSFCNAIYSSVMMLSPSPD